MTDREMLELAAKAIGFDFQTCMETEKPCIVDMKGGGIFWNPLTDDGDALRLAVKLGIEIFHDLEVQEVSTAFSINCPRLIGLNVSEAMGNDPYAATRRAIVRAAAEIGKSMP